MTAPARAAARGVLTAVVGAAAAAALAACALPSPPPDDLAAPTALPAAAPVVERTASAGDVAGFDTVERASLRVRNVRCEGGIATGSGFAVGDHTLVTNEHVVDGAGELQVSTYDGHDVTVRAAGVSRLADLALVRTTDPLPEHLTLADADPGVGAEVTVVGFPLGGPMTTTRGAVTGVVPDPLETMGEVLATDAEVEHGSSGSPVLDGEGRVVGVVYAGAVGSDTSFAVPVSVLADLLDEPAPEVVPTC